MSLRAKASFDVSLAVERVTRIPQNTGTVQVKWRITNSTRPETRGHTDFVQIENNQASFDTKTKFSYRMTIGSETKLLKSGSLVMEVFWTLPGMSKVLVGTAHISLAQFAEHKDDSISILLDGSRSNCLVTIKLILHQKKGSTNYKVPENTAKIVTSDISTVMDQSKKKKSKFFNADSVEDIRNDYLLHWAATPYHISPVTAIQEVIAGKDGFSGKPPPPVADYYAEHEKTAPYQESDIRETLTSWAWPIF